MLRHAVFLLLLCLLCDCAADQDEPPRAASAPAVLGAYRVQVGDVLGVRLYMNPDLNEDVTVRPDGRISTTLAQAVPAAGLLPEDIAASLRERYARELKHPDLTVEVKSPAPQRIFVTGEVVAPGEYDSAGPPLTLVQAVARAGGLRPTGDPGAIFVLRRGGDGKPAVLTTNYRAAVTGKTGAADITLASFDTVCVPKSRVSQVYLWFNQHFQQFMPVNWGFSYNVNPLVGTNRP